MIANLCRIGLAARGTVKTSVFKFGRSLARTLLALCCAPQNGSRRRFMDYAAGGTVLAKPWGQRAQHPGLFTKLDFKIDLRSQLITCPAAEVEPFEPGETIHFDPVARGACPLRSKCTQAASGKAEPFQLPLMKTARMKFRKLQETKPGRAQLRKRTYVEHALAHIAARKGYRARYVGVRRNLFDLRRAAAIQNLEGIHFILRHAA